ncbi:hypothetical protein VPH35_095630 [Triticum aestivum]|nr:uncharacterized protein LOC120964295 [Aegilops tauschii subsp. strangulata]XP_044400826.1 uncharacterized protein LOC123124231 [Triticum aestivum]
MEAKSASGAEERSMSISVAEECTAAEEARIIKKYLLAAFIRHAFNFFFVVVLAGYIICMYGALKYYPLLYAIAGIAFMSPYFIMMLKMLPLLKGFYIERYATDPYQRPVVRM